MVKVSEKNRHLASYLKQNEDEFMVPLYDWQGTPYGTCLDEDKLAAIIQEFYDELC